MPKIKITLDQQKDAEGEVDHFRKERGPFVVATETTPVPMLFTNAQNPHHPIIFANDSLLALSGFTRKELLGQNLNFLLGSGVTVETMAQVETRFLLGPRTDRASAVDPEIRCRHKDGSSYWASLFISPVHDKDGIIVQYFASLIDVTKYREHLETESRMQELQTELVHTSRSMIMGEMAENLAHELNQPLSAIVNYLKGCYRILECMEGPQVPMLREGFKGASEQALRAGYVIRHLREFVVRGDSERAPEELQGLIEEAAHLALLGVKDRGLEVTFDFAHRKAIVLVNRTQIQQVLLNLIRNAVEAMDHTGQRKLIIKTNDVLAEPRVQVSVVDSGSGIAPAVLDKLFTPFTSTKKTGMGVGLSICQRIIEAHGGKLWAQSLPGTGSAFHFDIGTVEKGENPDD